MPPNSFKIQAQKRILGKYFRAETTQTLPNAVQPIPMTNRTELANYLTHIILLNYWWCSLAELKDAFFT